ncbi:MAG: hypothetical protein HYY49_11490 [Ignavibacteriales bacterium]|nr:hypothetical protein [Ignavibacteriales bacterium]
MMKLKRLSKKGVSAALDKAERYRLLNEPREAESICLDVLEADPKNQKAIVMLFLAMTDQFGEDSGADVESARDVLARIRDKYKRLYYEGILCERQAKATLKRGMPGSKFDAYEWFREAMDLFEKAEAIRPVGNDEAILRWNTCARIIMQDKLAPREEEKVVHMLE